MKRMIAASIALTLAISMPLNAQIVVDGQLDANGYTLAATQTNNTGFGDNFSEWNALYTGFEGNRLFILITGNLEGNFNKLEVFFDTVDGGENSLSSAPLYDFPDEAMDVDWNSQRLGGIVSGGQGLTFDTGFEADFHIFARRGFDPNAADLNFNVLDLDFIDRLGGKGPIVNGNSARVAFDFDAQVGSGSIDPMTLANNAGAAAISSNIDFAFDNNNMAGVSGDTSVPADQTAAEAVTTGLEFSIDVTDLGIDPLSNATIKFVVIQNGASHDFVSNQILPGVDAPMGNLGGDNAGTFTGDCGNVDLNAFAGDQFVCLQYMGGGGCPFMPGDVNEDGAVNLLDVGPFVNLLSTGGFVCQADLNDDGSVNLLDVGPFVDLLGGGG